MSERAKNAVVSAKPPVLKTRGPCSGKKLTTKKPAKRTQVVDKPTGKKKTNDEGLSECVVCCRCIVDGKEDALFCEGKCNGWFHRYCAGVPLSYFKHLSSSPTPFYCIICSHLNHDRVSAELKETVESMKTTIANLSEELNELRVRYSSAGVPDNEDGAGDGPVGGGGDGRGGSSGGGGKGGGSGGSDGGGDGGGGSSGGGDGGGDGRGGGGGKRGVKRGKGGKNRNKSSLTMGEGSGRHLLRLGSSTPTNIAGTNTIVSSTPINGVRRVWGTLKTTTTGAVKNALSLVPEIPANTIVVKRKYKVREKNVTRWWFNLRASEETLQQLESHWQRVQIQTAWKLEPVFYNAPSTSSSTVHHMASEPNNTISVASEEAVIVPESSQHESPLNAEEQVTDSNLPSPPLLRTPLQEEGEHSPLYH